MTGTFQENCLCGAVSWGSLDMTFTTDKQQHIEVTSKAPWYEIQDQ